MSCDRCKKLMWEYLAQELKKEDADFVKAHIETCASCKEEATQLQKVRDSLRSLPEEELPEGYHTELMEKLEQQKRVSLFPVRKRFYVRWKQASLLAAAVLLVVAVGGMQGVLSLQKNQSGLMYDIETGEQQETNPNVLDHSFAGQEEKTRTTENRGMQVEEKATEESDVSQIESMAPTQEKTENTLQNVAPTQEKVESAPQLVESHGEQEIIQQVEEESPQVLEQETNSSESVKSVQEEAVPPLVRAEMRTDIYRMTDENSVSEVQQQVILTVASKEGMIDTIRNLAISLEGYEVGQSDVETIKVAVPLRNAENFMDSLKELGETRNLEFTSEEMDPVLFEITIEVK